MTPFVLQLEQRQQQATCGTKLALQGPIQRQEENQRRTNSTHQQQTAETGSYSQ